MFGSLSITVSFKLIFTGGGFRISQMGRGRTPEILVYVVDLSEIRKNEAIWSQMVGGIGRVVGCTSEPSPSGPANVCMVGLQNISSVT